MPNKRIHFLVVDDDDINGLITKKIIAKSAFEIDLVIKKDGQQALDYLKDLTTNNLPLPNIILSDINMPVMDGWEFIDNCVEHHIIQQTNLYVFSSSIFEQDLARARQQTLLKGFISKPLSFELLAQLIKEIKQF